jgi:hypothetical protein
MEITHLTEKELKDKQLVKEHRELLENFMKNELSWHKSRRDKILRAYDDKVDENNIRFYMFRKLRLFLTALLTNRLNEIANYFPKDYTFNKEQLSGE